MLFQVLWGNKITIFGSLYLAHLFSSSSAFFLYRKFVFKVTGNIARDYIKFQSVYVFPLLSNTIILPFLILTFHLNPYISQAITMVVLTLFSYFGHKLFSFRRPEDIVREELK